MIINFIVLTFFGIGLILDTLFEHKAYASLLGQITQLFDAIHISIGYAKQAMLDLYQAIFQSRFN